LRMFSFAHLKDRLLANSFWLLTDNFATTVINFAFWSLAIRLYEPGEIGFSQALVSIGLLIMVISRLGLENAAIRYVGTSGEKIKLLRSFFTIAIPLSIAIGMSFVIFSNDLAPDLAILKGDVLIMLAFMLFIVFQIGNTILDGAMISMASAKQMAIKNITLSILKIIFLVSLSFFVKDWTAIFVALTAAFGVGLAIALAVFASVLRRRTLDERINDHVEHPLGDIVRFSATNYFMVISLLALPYMLPVLILNMRGPVETASFYFSWVIASMLFVIPYTFSSMVLSEGSKGSGHLVEAHSKGIRYSLSVLILPAIALIVLDNRVLMIFGDSFIPAAAWLLRLLAISSFFVCINAISVSRLNIEKRYSAVLLMNLLIFSCTIVVSFIMMPSKGLAAIGIGWLIGQGLASLVAVAAIRSRGTSVERVTADI